MHRLDSRQRFAAILAALALTLPALAAAQAPPALAGRLYAAAGNPAVDDRLCSNSQCSAPSPAAALRFGERPGLGATLVEFRSSALPGQPQRAQHGLGIRSRELESALNAAGVEARHCLAPVVRMHSRLSASFELSGTLWVYLRCTLQ